MGTREVYEQKLRSGNLRHDPTMLPGLGSPRCPRCLSLLDPLARKGETIAPVFCDSAAVDSPLRSSLLIRLELELVQCSVQLMLSTQDFLTYRIVLEGQSGFLGLLGFLPCYFSPVLAPHLEAPDISNKP